MRWSRVEDKELKALYFKQEVSIKQIAKILGRTTASINQRLSKKYKRNRSLPKFTFPTKLTPALVRIHAHICGDGNLFRSKERDCYGYMGIYKPNSHRFRYGLGYTNLNQQLINEFIEDIKLTFNLRPYCRGNYVRIKSRDAWTLLKELGAGKSRDWFISIKIMKAGKEIKKHWIRAFFDDEACFNAGGRIRVRSVNRDGINQVLKMIEEFVSAHITPRKGYYPDHSVYLNINKSDAQKYFSKIGSLRYKNNKNN